MTAHVVEIELAETFQVDDLDRSKRTAVRYRWRCSCGQLGIWKPKAINARRGGVQHVQKMEK